nr:DUF4418 family protein [Schaalia odontolytica]
MAKKDVIIPLVPAALSALLLAGGVTVFSACEQRADGSWMHCHQGHNMAAGSAVGVIALYGASSLVKNKPARLALLALAVIASVVVFFIPGGICPLCAMKTMRCHTVFQPFVRIMSVLVAGSGIGALVASWKKDAKPSA